MAEIEFRTGKREVPDYMADLMEGLPTHKLTYEQAVDAMNREMVVAHLDRSMQNIIIQHFERRDD